MNHLRFIKQRKPAPALDYQASARGCALVGMVFGLMLGLTPLRAAGQTTSTDQTSPTTEQSSTSAPAIGPSAQTATASTEEAPASTAQIPASTEESPASPAEAPASTVQTSASPAEAPAPTAQTSTSTVQTSASPVAAPATGYALQLQSARALEARAYQTKSVADYRAAADALEPCSRMHPEDLSLHRSLGYLYVDVLNEPQLAYPHLEAVYEATPDAPGWGEMLADAADKTGRLDREIQVLREVLQRNPQDAWSCLVLAQALRKAGRFDDADHEFQEAAKIAPNDEWINISYAEYLHSRGRNAQAERIAQKVYDRNPKSAAALALLGDIHRSNGDLSKAQAEYSKAMMVDPSYYYQAKAGLSDIQRSESPVLKSNYFLFEGTDNFYQSGLFDTISAPVTDHLLADFTFNTLWFTNDSTTFKPVTRFEEAAGLEDRLSATLTISGGATGFEIPDRDEAGFNLGATVKPTPEFWMYGSYRFNDPVNDSIDTVAEGITQNVIGLSGGYQITNDLSATVTGSRAYYSDGNTRNFLHAEPQYMVWRPAELRIGAAYEALDYSINMPAYSSPHWYQTMGPVIEVNPYVFKWLSFHARYEPAYVVEASQWGAIVSAGPTAHIDDRFELGAEYIFCEIPDSFLNYSGSGFRVTLSYRF